ncbi:MAG: hypothetical protein A3K30_00775 [Deltaproteobacteria bacterium RBG_13_51_10]|nr:MAG: hypothetical protein A3K30_00775 [Deltaproteobacteria bacterium RBG_13_51_10]
MFIAQEGSRLKYRPTGTVFEVKKITNQFVILNSADGSTQIVAEKKSLPSLFEFEKVPQAETTHEEHIQDILSPKGTRQSSGRQEKPMQHSRK